MQYTNVYTHGRTETQTEVTHSPILISAHLSVSTLAAAAARYHSVYYAHPILHATAPLTVRPCFYFLYI